MSKTEADNIKKIETSFLKKHDYFTGWRSGTITWTNGWSGNKSSVGIEVCTMNDENYLRIHYTQTDNSSEEKKEFDYKVQLEKTPCHFGGFRYWFRCNLYKRGVYCGRRVGVLYKDGDWFGCRHCYELTYSSRNANRGHSHYPLFRVIELEMQAEKLEMKTRNYTYRGRPTKKRQKLERIYRQIGVYYPRIKKL
jgi:hypothetical protein